MSYKPDLPWLKATLSLRKPARVYAPARGRQCSRNGLTEPNLGQIWALRAADSGRRDCAPAGGAGPRGSRGRAPPRRPPPTRARAATPGRPPRGSRDSTRHDGHVVEHDGVLELERGQARQHLLEPLPVRVERPERLIRLREDLRDRVELVPRRPDKDRDRLSLLRDRDDECSRLLGHAFGCA